MGRRRSGFGKYIRVRIEACVTKLREKKGYIVEGLGRRELVGEGRWTSMMR